MGLANKKSWSVSLTEIITYNIEVGDCETESEAISKARMERPGEWQTINRDKEYMAEPLENQNQDH